MATDDDDDDDNDDDDDDDDDDKPSHLGRIRIQPRCQDKVRFT